MRVCHNIWADDPNLVSCAGLVPVMALAERAGLHDLAAAHVRVSGSGGSNPVVKVGALVAGMVVGADSIELCRCRHRSMTRTCCATVGWAGCRPRVGLPRRWARSCGAFTFGHLRQLDAVASRLLVNLAGRAPLLVGADQVAFVCHRCGSDGAGVTVAGTGRSPVLDLKAPECRWPR